MRAGSVIFILIAGIAVAGRADAEANGGLRLQIHGTPQTVFRQVDFAADKRLVVTSGSGGVTFWDAQRGLELGSYLEDWQSTAPRFVQGAMTPAGW